MRGENAEPLTIHLVWGSVWERNYKDLQRIMMDFRRGLFSVGLSMGEEL